MDPKDLVRFNAQAGIFNALSHPTRVFIVAELLRGKRCVCDLKNKIGVGLPTVSKHLSILKNAGLVRDEKQGNWVYYSLEAGEVKKLMALAETLVKTQARERLGLVS